MAPLIQFIISVIVLVLVLAIGYWICMKIIAQSGGPPWLGLAVQIFFVLIILVVLLYWIQAGMPPLGHLK